MTSPYPPRAPKRLERSRSDKFLFGVCGGLARYLNVDPTLVRVLTVALTLFTGVPIIVYLVAAVVTPEENTGPTPPEHPPAPPHAATWTPPPPAPGFGTAPTAPDPVWGAVEDVLALAIGLLAVRR